MERLDEEENADLIVTKNVGDKTYIRDYKIPANPETTSISELQFPLPSKTGFITPKKIEKRKIPCYIYRSPKKPRLDEESEVLKTLLEGKPEDVKV